jgi:hypothetical protein
MVWDTSFSTSPHSLQYRLLKRVARKRWVRRFFLANGLITPVFAIAYFYPTFSVSLLMIGGVSCAITVPGCLLSLALFFHRTSQVRPHALETTPAAQGVGSDLGGSSTRRET